MSVSINSNSNSILNCIFLIDNQQAITKNIAGAKTERIANILSLEKRDIRQVSKPYKDISAIGGDFKIANSYSLNNNCSRNNNQSSTTNRNCVENKKEMHLKLFESQSVASEVQEKNLSWSSEYIALKHKITLNIQCTHILLLMHLRTHISIRSRMYIHTRMQKH